MKVFFFCRQLECQGQEEEHHWNWPPQTPEGCLPQIQVRCIFNFLKTFFFLDVNSNVKTCLDSDAKQSFNILGLNVGNQILVYFDLEGDL